MLGLLIASVRFGFKIGLLGEVNFFIRLMLRLEEMEPFMRERYDKPIPLIGRCLKWRVLTKAKKRARTVVVFFQDLLLISFAGIGVVVLNYTYNDGRNRLFTLIGIGCGYLLCRIFAGVFFKKWISLIVFSIEKYISILFYIIFHPFFKILKALCKKMKKIEKNISKSIANKKKKEYNLYVKKYILKKAEYGFLNEKR